MPTNLSRESTASQTNQRLSRLKTPSGEQVQNHVQFYSNMEMTGWVLIVGNVTPCVVYPEGTKVSV